ncbi:MAG: tRNA pseudouridine(55) synthase TruB [Chloroflexota bacterium]
MSEPRSEPSSRPAADSARSTHDTRAHALGLHGILIVAKPAGPTSHDIVALVRRLTGTKRVGHGGTLDPFATGVLPLFLGRATRLVEYHLGDRKAYRATICFGASSTTDDLDGELTPADGPAPDRAAVQAALATQVGPIAQVPPAYSAIKLGGRRAYAMARAGETPVLAAREVTIDRLELIDWDGTDPDRPIAIVEVDCSAGTYVRSLARDVGRVVGSAAYLGALVRTGSGGFRIDRAHSLEAIRAGTATGPAGLVSLLLPLDTGLEALPRVTLSEAEVVAVGRGQFVRPEAALPRIPPGEHLIAVDENARIVAVGGIRDGRFHPDKVLVESPSPVAVASRA